MDKGDDIDPADADMINDAVVADDQIAVFIEVPFWDSASKTREIRKPVSRLERAGGKRIGCLWRILLDVFRGVLQLA